jgi:hypothetical protein
MAVCCRECEYWDNAPDHRLPDTYATCNFVEGPDAPLNSLAYVDRRGTSLVTHADYGCVQFRLMRCFADELRPRRWTWQGQSRGGE